MSRGLYGMRLKARKMRNQMPPENRRKNWLARKQRESIVEYVERTKRIFAWGAKSRRNSNTTRGWMGTRRSNQVKVEDETTRAVAAKRLRQHLARAAWQNAIRRHHQREVLMAKRNRDGTVKTGPFGPYRPMRGAWGQAVAIQTKVTTPTSPTEARLQPAGKSYELTYRGINKLRDWN